MSMLTDVQINFISREINGYGKLSRELKDDLIDHFCCAIEDEMAKGKDFETAYHSVCEKICPNGLDELLEENSFIPTSGKRKQLSQTLKISGIITLAGGTAAALMKLLHFPFGQMVLILTAAVAVFIFLPALFLYLFQKKIGIRHIGRFPYVAGCIGTVLLIASIIFHLSHWPGTAVILIAAVLLIDLAFFPLIFTRRHKKQELTVL